MGFLIVSNIFLGWALWTLVQYWGYRYWHFAIRKQFNRGNPIIEGEKLHHFYYDDIPIEDNIEDPQKFFVGFPWTSAGALCMLISVFYIFVGGITAAFVLAFSAIFVAAIDDQMHRLIHLNEYEQPFVSQKKKGKGDKRSKFIECFRALHQVHHQTYKYNYAFFLGLPWDMLFRTFCTWKRFEKKQLISV